MFILPIPAFAICNLGNVAGAPTSEDWGKKVIEYLSLLHILGNQVSCFLLERAHMMLDVTWTEEKENRSPERVVRAHLVLVNDLKKGFLKSNGDSKERSAESLAHQLWKSNEQS